MGKLFKRKGIFISSIFTMQYNHWREYKFVYEYEDRLAVCAKDEHAHT